MDMKRIMGAAPVMLGTNNTTEPDVIVVVAPKGKNTVKKISAKLGQAVSVKVPSDRRNRWEVTSYPRGNPPSTESSRGIATFTFKAPGTLTLQNSDLRTIQIKVTVAE